MACDSCWLADGSGSDSSAEAMPAAEAIDVAAEEFDVAAGGRHGDSAPGKDQETPRLQQARAPSVRIGVSRTAFSLFSAFPAAPYLHPLRLLRFRIVILRPRRKILQRFEILQHIVIFQDRQILHQSLVVIRDNWRNRGAGAVAKPQRHQ